MGTIHINGKNYSYQGADASNSVIKAANGKYYQKGANGKYCELKQNGESIFSKAKQAAENSRNYNKAQKLVPNKKYYVKGNPSYFTMLDKNYNTVYYKDNQKITKEQFLKEANCFYDKKSNHYVAKDANKTLHKYDAKFRKTVKDSKTGRYYVNIKGGTRKYFEANGKEISERAFLDTEKAYIDSNGQIAKYDWKAKAKNAAIGVGNMFADMFTKEEPIYKKDAKGKVLLDKTGKPVTEKNNDGSSKTKRKFSLSRTCTTVIVGAAIAVACVFAAPVVAAGAAAVGIGAGTAATIGTVAGVATQLGIAGYFGYEGGKQMYEAEKENQNVMLSNNERMQNWKKKGAGGAQVGMSLLMAKSAVKNAPKTHASARNTVKAIETKNNATLMNKGKVGFRDRVANARAGFSETAGPKSLKNTVKNYHKNNSLKTKAASTAKAPLKVVKNVAKETSAEPVRLVSGTLKTGARLVTKKGRAKIKGDIKAWKDSFRENPQAQVVETLTPEQIKARQESFNNEIANMPKEAEARIKKYESLIKNTTDKNQVGQLLDVIKHDKELTNSQRADVATKFFEKNDAQYPGVLETARHQKAELGLKKAKTLEDLTQVDRKALSEKSQKNFDKKKTELEKKEIKKASLEELKNIDRNTLTKDAQAAYDKRLAKLEKQKANLKKKVEVSENISTKNNHWTYEDMLAEIKQLEADINAGKVRTLSEIKAQLSHQNANYRKLPNDVKTDLHNKITSLERKFTEKAVKDMKEKIMQ